MKTHICIALALVLALLFLSGCTAPDGARYVLTTQQQLHEQYIAGAMRMCIESGVASARRDFNWDETTLPALVEACQTSALRMFVREFYPLPMPEPRIVPRVNPYRVL